MSDPPHRRLRLKLDMEADELSELVSGLTNLAWDIQAEGREERETTSGGYGSGYHLTLSCNPEMDGERFRSELAAWVKNKRLARVPTPDQEGDAR